MKSIKKSLIYFLSLSLMALSSVAQQEVEMTEAEAEAQYKAYLDSFSWKTEGTGSLGKWASIEIPSNFRYLNGKETDKLMQAFGNLPSQYEGMIAVEDVSWFVLFQFEESGYVKDDEKDDLNPDKLLKDLKSTEKEANKYRKEMGLEALHTVGWAVPPRYNEQTNNLEWGLLLRDDYDNESVNYNTKLLGREGIMNVTLVCDPSELNTILGTYQGILTNYAYKPGHTYAEFKDGDRIAEYGLTALIAGGALYGAAKVGLLANIVIFFKKGFKFIIVGILVIGAAIKKFFMNLGGGKGMDRSGSE